MHQTSKDYPTFSQNLLDHLTVQRNKNGGNATTHRNPLKKVQNIANSLDLIDLWRTLIQTVSVLPGGELNLKCTVVSTIL